MIKSAVITECWTPQRNHTDTFSLDIPKSDHLLNILVSYTNLLVYNSYNAYYN